MKPNQEDLSKEQTLMAAERTYLAWIRTALALIGGGLAIARFVVFITPIKTYLAQLVGHLLIAIGAILCIMALISYRRIYAKVGSLYEKHYIYNGLTIISLLLFFTIIIIFSLSFKNLIIDGL